MTERDWEKRWQQRAEEEIPPPDPWLLAQLPRLTGGAALDLACGRGRNSLALAAAGYRVLAVDIAPSALTRLRQEAERRALPIETRALDLEAGLPEHPARFDLILCFYFLQRDLFAQIRGHLNPGGLFLGRSFCHRGEGLPQEEIIYRPGELREYFSDWEILAYDEGTAVSNRGGTLAGILARKPFGSPA